MVRSELFSGFHGYLPIFPLQNRKKPGAVLQAFSLSWVLSPENISHGLRQPVRLLRRVEGGKADPDRAGVQRPGGTVGPAARNAAPPAPRSLAASALRPTVSASRPGTRKDTTPAWARQPGWANTSTPGSRRRLSAVRQVRACSWRKMVWCPLSADKANARQQACDPRHIVGPGL